MKKLIGIHGAARSGKDTLARLIMEERPYVRMAFADPLKKAVMTLFDLPGDVVFSDDKSQVIPGWGLTLRDILQRFGTEAMRNNFGEDFWIKRWSLEYDSLDAFGVVLTDVRFENETRMIRHRGGLVVHLERPTAGLTGAYRQHASEQPLVRDMFDYVVDNSGTLAQLKEQAKQLAEFVDGTQ